MILMKGINIPEGGRWVKRDVLVSGATYTAVEDAGGISELQDAEIIQGRVRGCERFVVPGAVDPHVHVREPGFSYKEDWETCSKAALRGGFSMIYDMPNNKKPVADIASLHEKKGIALKKSLVDFGLYIALTEKNAGSIGALSSSPDVCGIKVYAAQTTGDILVESKDALMQAFSQLKPVLVHSGGAAGLQKILSAYETASTWNERLPVLYLCHTSTEDEVGIVRKWKKKYRSIIAEVTPHHLFLNEKTYTGLKRVLPPLAQKSDNEALFDAVRDGTIDILGTDHAPHTLEEKQKIKPPAGFPGLETALSLLYTAHINGRLSLESVLRLTSEKAAGLFTPGIRLSVRPGCRASCTILEEGEFMVGEDGYSTKCGWSPFDGWKVKMRPVATLVAGRIAFEHGIFHRHPVHSLCG